MLLLTFLEALRNAVIRSHTDQPRGPEEAGTRQVACRRPVTRVGRLLQQERRRQLRRGKPMLLSGFVLASAAMFLHQEAPTTLVTFAHAAASVASPHAALRMRTSFLSTH